MKLGTEQHKQLFCHSFINSYLDYEPEKLNWSDLDPTHLERLRGIPFWKEALETERKAGVMVSAFAQTISDPLIKQAIALQGREEARHGRLIKHLIARYEIQLEEPPTPVINHNKIESVFTKFGFGECLDSFFAFGMFDVARQAKYLPETFFTIFDPILDEEARHIVFFVNWVTYLQIQRGKGTPPLRGLHALWHYGAALGELFQMFDSGASEEENEEKALTLTGAANFMDDLTPEMFLATCLEANQRRMSKFEPELLQPQLMPRLSQIAYNCLRLLPKKLQTLKSA